MDDPFDFMSSVRTIMISEYEHRLNGLYFSNIIEYYKNLEEIKSYGYKVYRNNIGKHKIIYNGQ